MQLKQIDHIVIIVSDIERTAKFYIPLLGQPIDLSEDQVAFDLGGVKIFFGLPYGEYVSTNKDHSSLNHIAFRADSFEDLNKFLKLLEKENIKNSGIQEDKFSENKFIWFDDPDSYRVEIYHRK